MPPSDVARKRALAAARKILDGTAWVAVWNRRAEVWSERTERRYAVGVVVQGEQVTKGEGRSWAEALRKAKESQ